MLPTAKGSCMKKLCFALCSSFFSLFTLAQQTFYYKDPQQAFYQAKEYFQKGQYNLAYPLLKELQQRLTPSDRVNNSITAQEIDFYTVASALKGHETRAEDAARDYIRLAENNA